MAFLGLFLLVLMIVVAILGARRDRNLLMKQMEDDGIALARAYALSAENALILKGAGLSRVAGEAGRVPGISFLAIVGPDFRVLAHSEPSRIGENLVDPEISRAFETPIGAVEAGRTPIVLLDAKAEGGPILRVTMPLVILDQVRGVMEIGLKTDLIREASFASNRAAFVIALGAYLVGIVFIVFFAASFTRPLHLLSQAADRMSSGDLAEPVSQAGHDEVSRLATAFERMRSELAASFESLRERAREIEELRAFSENILNSIAAGVLTLDLGGRVRGVNQSALAMLKTQAPTLLGASAREVFAAWPELATAIVRVLEGQAVTAEVLVDVEEEAGEKKPHLLRLVGTSLRDEEGSVTGDVIVLDDVTHVRSMERRMRDAEKMAAMGELAAGVAHEVRNPLGSIRNAAQFLEGKMDGGDPMLRFPRLIMREADRLNALVTRLLQYTRPETGGMGPCDLREALDQAVVLAELRIAGSRIRVERRYEADLPRVLADPSRVVQAVLNLLFNAIEAIPGQGRIGVEARREGEASLVVAVEDSGRGIPAESLSRMFDPFFSLREGGTGLGLSIVKQIASEHGGSVAAESRPGLGTTVTMTFPCLSKEVARG
jgi:nitrogen fixation/metabolism regulation signal transduction histidine kinase